MNLSQGSSFPHQQELSGFMATYSKLLQILKDNFKIPVFAYQVSGEYSLIVNSINQGIVSDKIILETLISFKRAGANAIITYFADKIARDLK